MRTNLIKKEDDIAVAPVSSEGRLDMVIAFDTTGSMNMFIKEVRNHVKGLIPQLFTDNPNIRISIVAFGDYCDMPKSNKFGKAYQVIGLTDNQEALINFVENAQSTFRRRW